MSQLERGAILKILDASYEKVGQAEDLLSNGEGMAALQLLLETKKVIREVVVILIVHCLRESLEAIDGEDQLSSEKRLRDLIELMNFAMLALCLDCQNQIGAKLKEA